jgi:hypothetical protein
MRRELKLPDNMKLTDMLVANAYLAYDEQLPNDVVEFADIMFIKISKAWELMNEMDEAAKSLTGNEPFDNALRTLLTELSRKLRSALEA